MQVTEGGNLQDLFVMIPHVRPCCFLLFFFWISSFGGVLKIQTCVNAAATQFEVLIIIS